MMTEDEARTRVRERFGVSRETMVAAFVDLVVAESERQNLISKATMDVVWVRHILDSAQLIDLLPDKARPGPWVDIGTGAGFPGMVIALLTDQPMILVEPRRKRAEFLSDAAQRLGIAERVEVHARKVEQISGNASVISARAVAPLPELLASARHIASRSTIWLLPKGINAREEVEAARRTWHGSFHVEHSVTQPGSLIIIATDVSPR